MLIINFKNGKTQSYNNIANYNVSGNFLVITTKNTIDEKGNDPIILKTSEVLELNSILNFTEQIKTIKYDIK